MEKVIKTVMDNYNSGKISKEFTREILEVVKEEDKENDIAIIGISIKTTGVEDTNDLWKILEDGIDCVKPFPESRKKLINKYVEKKYGTNVKYQNGAFLEDIASFDSKLFKCSPKEASLMDPNQRIFLETAWKALENSGYLNDEVAKSKTGIYLGFSSNMKDTYIEMINEMSEDNISTAIPDNLASVIASRLSYLLDLRGPAMVIDTACSSSLVAVDTASKAIIDNECDMAIVGGVKIHNVPIDDEKFHLGIESKDGHTRAFDNNSTGTGIGEGSVAVVLKKLSNAKRDNDNIYAVIKGSSVNQDGKSLGITSPNPESQEDVIVDAWKNAGINPETIEYIECHGTGTPLGDPIEVNSITRAFKRFTEKENFCALSSVKSNLGHFFECSGLLSLVKVVLALNKHIIPKSINIDKLNEEINLSHSAVYINTENQKWDSKNGIRRCGISSFGFSGTNAHVIVEEYIEDDKNTNESDLEETIYVAPFSAESPISLLNIIKEYIDRKDDIKEINIDTLIWNLTTCRKHFSYRLAITTTSVEDLFDKLELLYKNGLDYQYDWKVYGYHKLVGNNKSFIDKDEITFSEKKKLTDEICNKNFDNKNLEDMILLCTLYCKGADVNWKEIYKFISRNKKCNLPGYVFDNKFTWVYDDNESAEQNINISSVNIEGKEKFTDLEMQVADVVADVMGFDQINVYDDLLDLGLDSLQAMDIADEIKDKFKVEVPIKVFMQGANILKLVSEIQNSNNINSTNNVIKVDKENRYEKFGMTNIQRAYILGRGDYYVLGNVSTHMYIEYETELDFKKFEIAFNKVIKKHPMLRTVLYKDLTQQILKEVPYYEIENINLSEKSIVECEEVRLKYRNEMSHEVFETEKWPLFNIKAITTNTKKYLLFGIDMLIADGFSLQIIIKDLLDFYNNEEKDVCEYDYCFRDYINEYSEIRNTDKYIAAKQYWTNQIKEDATGPIIPLKDRCENITKSHFNRKQHKFGKGSLRRFKEVVSKHGITVATALATIYAETLRLWSSKADFVINVAMFNRYGFNEYVNKLVGDFTSVMLLDISYDPNLNFWQKAKIVQNKIFEGIDNREYDGVEVISNLAKKQNNNNVKFPVVFTCVIADDSNNNIDTIGKEVFGVSQTPQVYLDNQARAINDELISVWDYIENLFDSEVIDDMFEYYNKLIYEILLELNDVKLGDYSNKLLEEYNSTFSDVKVKPVIDLFYKQVDNNSEKDAVIYKDKSITFKELDYYSNIIANYLIKNNVTSGDYIAVLTERNIESIINILGVLKAGAAYVPIDINYPMERRNYIYNNSNCKMLLESDLLASLENEKYESERPNIKYSIHDVMYTIYTSGSTGNPKGVVETQEAVINTILDVNKKFNVNKNDVILGVSSLCFDLSVYDVFASIITGATLVLVEDQRNISDLIATIEEKKITIWNSVPAIMNLVAQNIEFNNNSLRLVMLSGDWIPINLPEKIRGHFNNAEIISLGGATEGAIWSIYFPIKEIDKNWSSIPYGMPLGNQKMYILNSSLKQCPVNVEGEICIGGAGVALKYMNDEVKTKNSFVNTDEFGYIYRTGDFGVLRNEGYIEFLGRRDSQVKINGYRVELGEIEKCLCAEENVKDAAVIFNKNNNKLTAYITSTQENINKEEILQNISRYIPSYMMPKSLIVLEKFELTSNGKIDYKALQNIEDLNDPVDNKEVNDNKDLSDLERNILDIIHEISSNNSVSIKSEIFDIGVDSILLISIFTNINKKFNVQIPIGEAFGCKNIQELCDLVKKYQGKTEVIIPKAKIQKYYDTSYKQKELFLAVKQHAKSKIYNMISAIVIKGDFNTEKCQKALNKLIERHEALRTKIIEVNGDIVQYISDSTEYKIRLIDESNDDIKDIEDVIEKYTTDFNFDENNLFNFSLIKLNKDEKLLLFDIHHIIADGLSVHILMEDFLKLYREIDIKPLDIQYKDFIEWNNKDKDLKFDEEKEYWMKELAGKLPVMQLPYDYISGIQDTFEGNTVAFDIPKNIYDLLHKEAKESKNTIFSYLFATYALLISKYYNSDDVIIGVPASGRNVESINNVVGMFVNTLPIRIKLNKDITFSNYVSEVRTKTISYMAHQDFDFGKIMDNLECSTSNLFDCIFAYQYYDISMLKLGGTEFEPYNIKRRGAKVPLEVSILEYNDRIEVNMVYSKELFVESSINELQNEYVNLLKSVLENSGKSLNTILEMNDKENNKSDNNDFTDLSFNF